MIRAGRSGWFRFFRREVLPRWRGVFLHRNLWLSVSLGLGLALALRIVPTDAPFPAITFTDLCTATLAFAGLSFGGAMTSGVLAVGMPPDRVLRTMVVNSTDSETRYVITLEGVVEQGTKERAKRSDFPTGFRSLYSDLVFVFLYSAVAQLLLAVTSMACIAAIGGSFLSPERFAWQAFIGLSAITGVSTYAVLQLASSLKALSSVARNRDSFMRADLLEEPPNEDGAPAPPAGRRP
jgi:hypothetical protein